MKTMGIRCPPTLIEYHHLKFLISDMPNKCYMRPYIEELQHYNTGRLVRACHGDYNIIAFRTAGIPIQELLFEDGTFPCDELIQKWLEIVQNHFYDYPDETIAVHCRTGLGRSPVLVAIALMEAGLSSVEAVNIIKGKRRGTFNQYQLEEIHKYKSKNYLVEEDDVDVGFTVK